MPRRKKKGSEKFINLIPLNWTHEIFVSSSPQTASDVFYLFYLHNTIFTPCSLSYRYNRSDPGIGMRVFIFGTEEFCAESATSRT